MVDLITVSDVTTRLGVSLDATQTAQVEAFISDASGIVLEIGNPDWNPATSGSEPPQSVKSVVFQMVRRAYTNPDGFRAEKVGDYSYSRSDMVAVGGMQMTRDEFRTVRRAANKANVGTVGVLRPREYERQWIVGPSGEELKL